MTVSNPAILEEIDPRKLPEILRTSGPCITMVLPPYHPGESAKPVAALLKIGVRQAADQLSRLHYPARDTEKLLEPLERLANDPASLAGSHGARAIFRSNEVWGQLPLTQPAEMSLTVAGCFAIRPLLTEFWAPKLFYILAVSKDSVALFKGENEKIEAVPLPAGVPKTLADALELEPPDHDLENRSSIGSSTGSMHAVRFGTGSGRETAHAHLGDFYKLIDRGIHRLLGESGVPVLLAGVEQETMAFRAVSAYPHLVRETLAGSPALSVQDRQLMSQARAVVCADIQRRETTALLEALERSTPGRVLSGPEAILQAAFEGRVHKLYVEEQAARTELVQKPAYRSWGPEDLLNVATVQTILHGGSAMQLPRGSMPGHSGAAAILRY